MTDKTCQTCVHWDSTGSTKITPQTNLHCKRYPSNLNSMKHLPSDRCGEYSPIKGSSLGFMPSGAEIAGANAALDYELGHIGRQ